MRKLSKKRKVEILQEKFPEFYKLSKEFSEAIDAVYMELEEKMEKMEELDQLQEEIEDKKVELGI